MGSVISALVGQYLDFVDVLHLSTIIVGNGVEVESAKERYIVGLCAELLLPENIVLRRVCVVLDVYSL